MKNSLIKNGLFPSLILLIGIGLIFGACRKKGDNEKLDPSQNQSAQNLIPKDSGSWWLMNADDGSGSITLAEGLDSVVLGARYDYYRMVDTSNGKITPKFYAENDSFYISAINLERHTYQYVPAIICTVNPKEGDAWINTSQITYNGLLVDVKTEGKVTETGAQATFNGKHFTNVVKTENKLKARLHNTVVWFDCGYLNLQFAPNIGIICEDLDVHVLNFFQNKVRNEIVDYHIMD